jgi:hypothetical protein
MATMIPDPCPSKATAGETRVYSLLRDRLPDHYVAWYEPVVAGRYPDFIVMAPDFGLLFLEVKGWRASHIARASDQEVELHRSENGQARGKVHKHPTRQVRDYMFTLIKELDHADFAILRHQEGPHLGKPVFPCGFGVLLTSISRAQLEETRLSPIFPPERTICGDELTSLASSGASELVGRLKSLFTVSFPFDPMTSDQVKALRGALHREVVVRKRPATAKSIPERQLLLPGSV